MNTLSKILFWTFTIALGFVNPLISFGLIVLYYLPGIIQSICPQCCGKDEINMNDVEFEEQPIHQNMKDYSDDTLEKMK